MKKAVSLIQILFFLLPVKNDAQTFNLNFEKITIRLSPFNDTIPSGWEARGGGTTKYSYNGQYGASVWNWYAYQFGWLVNGSVDHSSFDYTTAYRGGIPFSEKPFAVTGYYYYDTTNNGGWGNDSAMAIVIAKKWNPTFLKPDTVAFGLMKFGACLSYKKFRLPLVDVLPGVDPDSLVISFFSCAGGHCVCNGASKCLYLYVDDLALETPSKIGKIENLSATTVSPNPIYESATVHFNDGRQIARTIILRDATGRDIRRYDNVLSEDFIFQRDNIPSGIYYLFVIDINMVEILKISI